jgi:hypothetical protein
MAAGFARIASACLDHAAQASTDTESVTPAVGDVLFCGAGATSDIEPTCVGGGLTWVLIHFDVDTEDALWVFVAIAGTPEAEALTVAVSAGTMIDFTYALIRPTELSLVDVCGADNTGASQSDTLVVALTTDEPAGLLAYGRSYNTGVDNWAEDSGWTELAGTDQADASGNSHQVQYRLSDDSEIIFKPAFGDHGIMGVCLQFAPPTDPLVAATRTTRLHDIA